MRDLTTTEFCGHVQRIIAAPRIAIDTSGDLRRFEGVRPAFAGFEKRLLAARGLWLDPKMENGKLCAFDLTTTPPEKNDVEPVKSAKAPRWLAIPVQFIACALCCAIFVGVVVAALVALPLWADELIHGWPSW